MGVGLSRAPSTFCRAMMDDFRDMLDDFLIIYIDDLLIYSKSLEEHQKQVEVILQRTERKQVLCQAGEV